MNDASTKTATTTTAATASFDNATRSLERRDEGLRGQRWLFYDGDVSHHAHGIVVFPQVMGDGGVDGGPSGILGEAMAGSTEW